MTELVRVPEIKEPAKPLPLVIELECPGGVETDHHLATWTRDFGNSKEAEVTITCEVCGFK